jgi:GNAT superfamily N-acetyltransferase
MMRSPVSLRSAAPSDAPALAELWCEVIRRADHVEQVADLRSVIERVTPLDDERIVVADYDGQLAGAVHLRVTTLTPLNLEPVLQAISPHVFAHLRRHGVGRALMDAAVTFAEERGISHVASAAVAGSRDANRFMARLGLGPHATLRVAPTMVVRAKLSARQPATGRASGRQLTHVLAARRSLRRSQAPTPG